MFPFLAADLTVHCHTPGGSATVGLNSVSSRHVPAPPSAHCEQPNKNAKYLSTFIVYIYACMFVHVQDACMLACVRTATDNSVSTNLSRQIKHLTTAHSSSKIFQYSYFPWYFSSILMMLCVLLVIWTPSLNHPWPEYSILTSK